MIFKKTLAFIVLKLANAVKSQRVKIYVFFSVVQPVDFIFYTGVIFENEVTSIHASMNK